MSSTIADSLPSSHDAERARTGPMLVAVGQDGAHILRSAATLAPVFGDRVHVFSAVEPLPVAMLASEPILIPPSLEEEREEARLDRLRTQIGDVVDPGLGWELEVGHEDPGASIARRARELDASLLVMGVGRHKPIDRIVGSETTLRVIRHASCPVLAVVGVLDHRPAEVVVATDFSPQCARAIEAALPLLANVATMHLVHVWEPGASADPTVFDFEEAYRDALPARFTRFVTALRVPAEVSVRTEIREGKIVPQLLAFAESRHADLIVAGRHGLNPVARFVIGSVTTALVRGTTCSVLVTPEPTASELDRLQRALTGTSRSSKPEEWARVLADFARRNDGRRTTLEIDDPAIGAQTQETGYSLMGTSYDRRDHRVELMFGVPRAQTPHLTRNIGGVDDVAVLTNSAGHDEGLCIKHGDGQTLLMLAPEP